MPYLSYESASLQAQMAKIIRKTHGRDKDLRNFRRRLKENAKALLDLLLPSRFQWVYHLRYGLVKTEILHTEHLIVPIARPQHQGRDAPWVENRHSPTKLTFGANPNQNLCQLNPLAPRALIQTLRVQRLITQSLGKTLNYLQKDQTLN